MKKLKMLAMVAVMGVSSALLAHAAPEIGKPAPDFSLTDVNGTEYNLADLKGKVVVLEWFNHDCPFVKKHYGAKNMQKLQEKYTGEGVVWLSINSSNEKDGAYRDAAATKAEGEKVDSKATALLLDASGTVGQAYEAKTTPHMYVINKEGILVYNGAIDSNSSADAKTIESATNYVTEALDAVLAGKEVETAVTKPYGCSVKY